MTTPRVECEYECPHSGQAYSMGLDAVYVDNVTDGWQEVCQECDGRFQLRCVSVAIELEVLKVNSK